MNPFLDGLFVLKQQAGHVLLVAGFMLWGAALGMGLLSRPGVRQLGPDEILSLASGAWMPAALLTAGLTLILGAVFPRPPVGMFFITLPAFTATLLLWSRHRLVPSGRRQSWIFAMLLVAGLAGLLLLRLAFMKGPVLPAYFDSAAHYGLIQQFVRGSGSAGWHPPVALPAPGYYHLGYHVLVAGLVRLTGIEIAPAMLTSGQLILATLPIALYLPAYRLTGSRLAGMFAVTLGAMGWYMPAHAVNWGKYPALFGLPTMLSAISLAYFGARGNVDIPARRAWWLGASLCALTAVLIQTRLGLVLLMLAGAWGLSGLWIAMARSRRLLWATLLLLVASALVALISRDSVQRQLLDPFVDAGIWATALVCLSLPLALRAHPRPTVMLALLVSSLVACLFVPGPGGSLLDRPLLEMLLPLPLSLLGAAGVAGFLRVLPSPARFVGYAAVILLAAAIVGNGLVTQGFGASPCCAMASKDDLVALDWLRSAAPSDARVAVALEPAHVNRAGSPSLNPGADSGIWIPPLSGLSIAPMSFVTDFGSGATHSLLCEQAVDYVYAGGQPRSFDAAALLAQPQWYGLRLQLPEVLVFEVKACELPSS